MEIDFRFRFRTKSFATSSQSDREAKVESDQRTPRLQHKNGEGNMDLRFRLGITVTGYWEIVKRRLRWVYRNPGRVGWYTFGIIAAIWRFLDIIPSVMSALSALVGYL